MSPGLGRHRVVDGVEKGEEGGREGRGGAFITKLTKLTLEREGKYLN